jgi:hypothetical protein
MMSSPTNHASAARSVWRSLASIIVQARVNCRCWAWANAESRTTGLPWT